MDIPSWLYRGAKVVCVNSGPLHSNLWGVTEIEEGQIYVVEDFRVIMVEYTVTNTLEEGVFVKLFGIRDGMAEDTSQAYLNKSFYLERFKPLHTSETDLEAHFKKLLDVPVLENT